MNLHHTNDWHGLGKANVKDFCISIKYIFINCNFIYYKAVIPYDYNHSYLLHPLRMSYYLTAEVSYNYKAVIPYDYNHSYLLHPLRMSYYLTAEVSYNYKAVIPDYNHSYLWYFHIILRLKSFIYIHFSYLMIQCNTFP
jgi:hypothetical protein